MFVRGKKGRAALQLLVALSVGAGAGGGITAGNAANAYSAVGSFTTAGKGYINQAQIYTSSGYARAYTNTGPANVNVPAGWIGGRGRLFKSSGALYCEGSNTYTTGTALGGAMYAALSCGYNGGAGAWYSYGVSLTWNGGGYNSTYTFKSPNQNS